jgi:hypothetical protein
MKIQINISSEGYLILQEMQIKADKLVKVVHKDLENY